MRERRVVLLIFPGFQPLDLTGPHEVFVGASRLARRRRPPAVPYRVEVVAAETMRRAFLRHLGVAPSDYRSRFQDRQRHDRAGIA